MAVLAAEQRAREIVGREAGHVRHPRLPVLLHGPQAEAADPGLAGIDVAVQEVAVSAPPIDGQVVDLVGPEVPAFARRDEIEQLVGLLSRPPIGDLGRDVRDAVAEVRERQVFEDDGGKTPKSRRTARADVRFDQRIGQLILRPRMETELEIGFGDVGARAGLVVDEFAVRPDPKHVLGRPLAEAEREGRKVGIRD